VLTPDDFDVPPGDDSDAAAPPAADSRAERDARALDAYSSAVVAVVERAAPSVVAIEVRGARGGGTGSGVLITPDGYAVTNQHVVAAGDNVRVHLPDGRAIAAAIVGGDPATDIALLRVHASALDFATLGSTKNLKVGQLVIALGNPLGSSARPFRPES
jgi:S1-C subfamily serine protease